MPRKGINLDFTFKKRKKANWHVLLWYNNKVNKGIVTIQSGNF